LRAQFRVWKLLVAAGLLALGAELGVGCGGGPDGGVCGLRCECEGCSNRDYNDCIDNAELDARRSDQRGCFDFYDELLACESATYICRNDDHFETACGPERDRWQRCIN
jgi:hypothetical protein